MKEFYLDSRKEFTIGDALRSIATGWKAQNEATERMKEDAPCS